MVTPLDRDDSLERLLDYAHGMIERAQSMPGEIAFTAPFLACMGHVPRHRDDLFFPEWSAFMVLRNDGCLVWQKGGYRGVPEVGERFVLNIHTQHGVRPRRRSDVLAVICADGRTIQAAERKREKAIRKMLRDGGL